MTIRTALAARASRLMAVAVMATGLVAAAVPTAAAGAAGTSECHPVVILFQKSAVAPTVFRGTTSGDVRGSLTSVLLTAVPDGILLRVTIDWFISAGRQSVILHTRGTIDTATGVVNLRGREVAGPHRGAFVRERGQLVNPDPQTFRGTIRIFAGDSEERCAA
jgi:hypothetical protein